MSTYGRYYNNFYRKDRYQVEPDTPLREAIKAMNINRVKELIQSDKSEINTHNSKGWTPLHEAATNDGRFSIFQYLLSAGADFDYKAEYGVSPFYVACKYGSIKIAKLLVELGCKINAKFTYDFYYKQIVRFGFTPLHVACTRKNEQIIMLLLANGAQMNVVDNLGRTPINYAIDNSNRIAVQMLIEAGADLDIKDIYGCMPLHYVAMFGNVRIFNLMKFVYKKKQNLNHQTPQGLTPLMLACKFKHYHICEALIQLGADTSVVDNSGQLALHMAANGGYRLFKLLFKNTSRTAIEKYATYRPNSKACHSLTCKVIDSHSFEILEHLFNSGLSEDVLKCPERINGQVVSPLVFLLLHSKWFGKEEKLQWLEFFLSYGFMVDPVYHNNENIIPSKLKCQMRKVSIDKIMEPSSRRIGSVEAVVQMHSHLHIDCYCEMFLSMILKRIASVDKFLPSDSSRQICLFNKSAREGFLAALSLLKYSEYVDPDDVIDTLLKEMASPKYTWMGHEDEVVKFLVGKCVTNFLPVLLGIKNALPEPKTPLEERKYQGYVRIEEIFKSNKPQVLSMKRLSRFAVRKNLREEAENSDVCFRSYLKQIILPSTLYNYILYDDYF